MILGKKNLLIGGFGVAMSAGCATRKSQKSVALNTREVTEESRNQVLAEADAWGEFWDGKLPIVKDGVTFQSIEELDASELDKIAGRDLKRGPFHKVFNPKENIKGDSASQQPPIEEIQCKFVEPDPNDMMGGRTPKFLCDPGTGNKPFKVKYDSTLAGCPTRTLHANVATSAEILATRLLWALGFKADSMYAAKVTCENCPQEPWTYIKNTYKLSFKEKFVDSLTGFVCSDFPNEKNLRSTRTFFPTAIEKKDKSDKIETKEIAGWGFNEIFLPQNLSRSELKAKRQRIHREALAMMAAFLEHWDNKSENQRLACLDKDDQKDGCHEPFLIIQDPGFTFGSGYKPLENLTKGKSLLGVVENDASASKWLKESMWQNGDSSRCIVKVNAYYLEKFTLTTQKVTPEGVNFFKSLFSRLSDQQIADLMEAGQVETTRGGIQRDNAADAGKTSKSDWVNAFKEKVKRDIMESKCAG